MKTSVKFTNKLAVAVVSLLLHALVLWFITSGGDALSFLEGTWLESRPPTAPNTPVVVEVVDMPTAPKDNELRPEEPTAFSERDHTTERETYPDKGRRVEAPSTASAKKSEPTPLKVPLKETPRKEKETVAKTEAFTAESPPFEGELPVKEPAALDVTPEEFVPRIFPSSDRLAALSERYERDTPVSERGKVLNINTSELKYQKYVMNMKRRIEFYWQYPSSSVRNSEQGRLKVNFKITKDGTVRDVDVVRSSNYPALDDAAVMAIKLASPFNPLPGDFGVDEGIDIHANFEYELLYPNR